MSDPNDLTAFLDLAWQRLGRGVADRRAAARHPVLATTSADGWPEARTVVLRSAQRTDNMLEIHTDAASAKVAALRINPRAQLHIWDEKPRLQLRIWAAVEVIRGPGTAMHWARVPEPSRAAYGKAPAQGTPIDQVHAYSEERDPAAFTLLRCHPERIDLVELGDIHRRAVYARDSDWAGQWLVP